MVNFQNEKTEVDKLDILIKELGEPDITLTKKERKKYERKVKAEIISRRSKKAGEILKEARSKTSEIEKALLDTGEDWIDKLTNPFLGRNRRKLQCAFIYPNRDIKYKKKKLVGKFIIDKNKRYVVQSRSIYKVKGKPTSYYYEGNPFPIDFDFERYEPLVNAESLHNAFQAKIVADLLSGGGLTNKQMAWTAGSIIAVGIAIAIGFSPVSDVIKGEPIFLLPSIMKFMYERYNLNDG